ncbi:Glycosyltransferase involved in cell wall bisynthesis [Flavobacterium sp. CF108]|uniref:glycosyltransferase family 4 protein n=1 Tax=unclassified Flavobacterium TaxID=196869 RepID=UPI0008BB411C|nr:MULTISPECIES: glycosyltransferase family 4 protein [unclassified Flavobacterium]SEO49915.1 Glycosyltransferase involved in cell wall bisynthesis [Flavobacterium sp. fv08]SHH72472.1 Glycosyltransferase involved in cell wall bisynthesis [Flavobacterium sp. CF108]
MNQIIQGKSKQKLIRITTVPLSLKTLLKGQSRFMSSYYEVIGISSAGKELSDVNLDEGIRVLPVEMTRKISPVKDLKSLYELYRILKKEKPFIVHSHTPKAGIISMLAAKFAHVPFRLHTVAGLPLMETTGNKRKLLNLVEKLTYRCATNVYPNSKGLYDFIVENKFTDKTKLKVLGNGSSNGINTNYFDVNLISLEQKTLLAKHLNIISTDFVFIFVGRLVSDKGINELIKSFNEISKDYNNAKLILVGSFEEELDPLNLDTLQIINENSKILSVGFQQDVRSYFAISDCLVFPSYREGFPNVVMQAGAMGLPSIVSDINGCNEIIEDGINGIIVPVKNAQLIYDSMQRMISDSKLKNTLKEKSREMIVSRYDQKVIWDAILDEYKKLENLCTK